MESPESHEIGVDEYDERNDKHEDAGQSGIQLFLPVGRVKVVCYTLVEGLLERAFFQVENYRLQIKHLICNFWFTAHTLLRLQSVSKLQFLHTQNFLQLEVLHMKNLVTCGVLKTALVTQQKPIQRRHFPLDMTFRGYFTAVNTKRTN